MNETTRIVVGVDGSEDSLAAVYEIAHRSWPVGTQVSVINATNGMLLGTTPGALYDGALSGLVWSREDNSDIQSFIQEVVLLLESAGLVVQTKAAEGRPASTILEIADEWQADIIFLGAKGHELLDRILLGSVSSSVVAHSRRAVEIVRIGGSASE